MEIKVVGVANMKPMMAQFAALKAEMRAFNDELRASSMIPAGGTRQGYQQVASQMGAMTRAFDSAIASSGKFRVEQTRLHDLVTKNTDLLRKQQLTAGQIFGGKKSPQREMMRQIYREQLAMQQMMVRGTQGTINSGGKLKASLYIPTEVHKSWDTLSNKVGMFRYELASASRGMLNWGKNTQWAGRQLTAGLTYPMLAVGAAAGVMAYKVDQQFTRIRKVYNTTADQASSSMEVQKQAEMELAKVRADGLKTASSAARDYGSSITDTLAVQADLAATGEKGRKLQEATTAVMRNAMLGEIDYQTATKATIALQQQLHASSSELADMWAYMNSVENSTSLQMKDFAEAIPIALGPIRAMGGDLHDLGTLMTGMVSQGIQVGKAANAIKALPQRLSRPSAQVQAEFAAMTGQDIMKINDQHGDNIIDLLTAIYHATDKLDAQARKKVFAGLFGSFQLSTMTAMVESMGDLEKGTNQVTEAQRIGMQTSADWAKVSNQEVKAFQQSVSGRFKIALETTKASLAQMGQPFLEMATHVLSGITKMIDLFNKLPKSVKKISMLLLIIGALAGPAIMLVGLFANLIGNVGLMAAAMLRLVTRFNILNKEEEASIALNRLAEKGLTNRATQTALLTQRVTALTEALVAQREVANIPGVSGMIGPMPLGAGQVYNPSAYGGPAIQTMLPPIMGMTSPVAQGRTALGQFESKAQMNARQAAAVQAERDRLFLQTQMNAKAAVETKIKERTQSAVKGTGVAMGAMGVAMAAQLVTDNKIVDTISKWTLLLAIGVPAAKGIAAAIAVAGSNAMRAASAAKAMALANAASTVSMGRLAGKTAVTGAAIRGIGAGFTAMMGPVGWIAAAIGTAGFALYKMWKRDQAVTKEKEAQARAIYDQNNLLSDQLKIEERKKKTIGTASPGMDKNGLPSSYELSQTMTDNKDYKDIINVVKSGSDVEVNTAIIQKYRDVLESTGGTAQKAQLYIEALFRASGVGALEAQRRAEDWGTELGSSIDTAELGTLYADRLLSSLNDSDKAIKESGTDIGKDLADAIATGTNEDADKILTNFSGSMEKTWSLTFDNISAVSKTFLADLGVNSAAEFKKLSKAWADYQDDGSSTTLTDMIGADPTAGTSDPQFAKLMQTMDLLNMGADGYTDSMRSAADAEAAVVKELAAQLGIQEQITTLAELRNTWEWKLQTANKNNTMNLYRQRVAQLTAARTLGGAFGFMGKISEEQQLQVARQLLYARGLRDTKDLDEAIALLTGQIASNANDITTNTNSAASAAVRLASAFSLSDDDYKSIYQTAMTGLQNSMAESASNAFDSQMNASIDSAQNGWDKRIQALQDAQQRAQDKFDARWDKRKDRLEAYYDNQKDHIDAAIKAEERAEAIRQKIFEAEQKRIDRMKDQANRNIDFNVALRTGNLDEAARIQNDARAAAQGNALEDAAAAGAGVSDQKVEALNSQKDLLDKQQQQAEDALAKREDRERKHLEKMQQMQSDSLQAQADASMEAYKLDWDRKKEAFDGQLDLFKSFVARNQGELEDWMKQVGLSYDDFGINIKGKGKDWSKYFNTTLQDEIRKAGVAVASDNMWSQWGAKEVKSMLMGMGFGSVGKFKKFIMSGILPDDFGKVKPKKSGAGPGGGQSDDSVASQHVGGWAGETNNRKGVARNTRGLHPTEVMIRAQKGEYIMDKRVAQKNPDVLEYMSKHGEPPPGNTREYTHARLEGLGGGLSMAGTMGAMARGVMTSLVGAFGSAAKGSVASARNAAAASASSGGSITPYAGTIGAPNKIGAQAINWAVDQIGAEGWYRLCQKFVRIALGAGGGFATAEDAWGGAKYRHSIADPNKVPPGVPVYWTDGGSGHVALSTGGGNVISTDYPNSGYVGSGTIAGITADWGKNLAGWTEDINGKKVYNVPGLSGGGYTTKDTPAVVHQNEMVIDAARTKKMYGLVDSITNNPYFPWMSLYKLGPNGMPDVSNFKTEADTAPSTSSSSGKTVKNGTYNVQFSSKNEDTQADLSKLFKMSDVLSLTEFTAAKRALIPWIEKQGWGVAGAQGSNESVVAYKKGMFSASKVGSALLNKTKGESLSGAIGKGGARSLTAAYALLSGNGMKFWQIAAHTIAHIWKNPTLNRKVQQEQYGSLGNLANRLGNGGTMPVFVGGDFNNDPRNMAGSRPGGQQGMQYFKPLTDAGLMSNWTAAQMAANPGGTMGGRYIDGTFYNGLAKMLGTKIVGGLHSDHHANITEFSLPQMAKGGRIRWDNTLANLHKNEQVLTADNTRHLDRGLENLANGAGNVYNNNIVVNGADMSVDELAEKIVKIQERKERRKVKVTSNR